MNDFPEDAIEATGEMYFSHPVSGRSLTIDFFIEEAFAARAKGLTHWATQTNKDDAPWTTILVFYKPKDK